MNQHHIQNLSCKRLQQVQLSKATWWRKHDMKISLVETSMKNWHEQCQNQQPNHQQRSAGHGHGLNIKASWSNSRYMVKDIHSQSILRMSLIFERKLYLKLHRTVLFTLCVCFVLFFLGGGVVLKNKLTRLCKHVGPWYILSMCIYVRERCLGHLDQHCQAVGQISNIRVKEHVPKNSTTSFISQTFRRNRNWYRLLTQFIWQSTEQDIFSLRTLCTSLKQVIQ